MERSAGPAHSEVAGAYISPDYDSHISGILGFWKIAKSPSSLSSKPTRDARMDALATPLGEWLLVIGDDYTDREWSIDFQGTDEQKAEAIIEMAVELGLAYDGHPIDHGYFLPLCMNRSIADALVRALSQVDDFVDEWGNSRTENLTYEIQQWLAIPDGVRPVRTMEFPENGVTLGDHHRDPDVEQEIEPIFDLADGPWSIDILGTDLQKCQTIIDSAVERGLATSGMINDPRFNLRLYVPWGLAMTIEDGLARSHASADITDRLGAFRERIAKWMSAPHR